VAREVGHLAARDARSDLDDDRAAALERDQLGEGDPVPQPQRVHGVHGDALGLGEGVAPERRRVDVDPADAEADPGRAETVGKRQQGHVAAARDGQPVQLEPVVEGLDDRLLGRRLGEGRVQVPLEVVGGVEPEDAALPSGVGRLEHGRETDRLERGAALVERPDGRELGLRHAGLPQPPAHRDLVRQDVRRLHADSGEPERLGDGGHDGHRAVGGNGQNPLGPVPAADVGHRGDVREVHDLGHVGFAQPGRLGIPVDGDDAVSELARALDRAPLVAPRADEEDRAHAARCYSAAIRRGHRTIRCAGTETGRDSSARSRNRRCAGMSSGRAGRRTRR
jgi:hypothetical protein